MYNTTAPKIKLSQGKRKIVALSQIIPNNKDWENTIRRYEGLIDRLNRGVPCRDSAWWKYESGNSVSDIPKRLKRFVDLYESIKRHGFKYRSGEQVVLLNIQGLKLVNPKTGGRISDWYYRTNGMRRLLICNYLGKVQIPCKVCEVRI